MSLLVALCCMIAAPPAGVPDFNRDVKPILANRCFACHGPDEKHREGGLRLDERASATAKLESENTAILPKRPDQSELLRRVRGTDDERMPPKGGGEALTEKEVAILERWIESGAEYSPHWSFVPPKPIQPPAVSAIHADWAKNPIDAFIAKTLEEKSLKASPPADRVILLRRLSFDLTGLPPTTQFLKEFLSGNSEDDYERAVDRLLADPGYGERWARIWLDLARYADSAGYGSDPLRTIWRYRDWVIDAHNRNLPFDEFTKVQLAGDLRPNPSLDDLVATAFHRNTMTNTEGGTDDEEFRIAAVKDRTDVTMQVWMGLTAGCAKCHSHKYDPISHKEYYQMTAFFNQTVDTDQPAETPTIPAPTVDQRRENRRIDSEIAAFRAKLKETPPGLAARQSDWERQLAPKAESAWKPAKTQTTKNGDSIEIVGNAESGASAIRLETPAGDVSLKDVQFSVSSSGEADKPRIGRFVRIELPGKQKMIHLAEVEVYSNSLNVARRGTAKQSSTYISADAKRAIDGSRDGRFDLGSVSHTNPESNPWWEVDLGKDVPIERVSVWNRIDAALESRLKGWTLSILDKDRKTVWKTVPAALPKPGAEFVIDGWESRPIAFHRTGGGTITQAKGGKIDGAIVKSGEPLLLIPASPLTDKSGAFRITAKTNLKGTEVSKSIRAATIDDPATTKRAALPANVVAALESAQNARNADQTRLLQDYFREQVEGKPIQEKIAKLDSSRPKPTTVPVMQELAKDKRRKTRVLEKGNFLQPGEEVHAGVPTAFHSWPSGAARDRSTLAAWLVSKENPLAARVAVNRLWSRVFGRGLVETEEDFGIQGDHPSHPELLDWLAGEYVRLGWDSKALLRLIVTSATYRQSTKASAVCLEKDPEARWLSRFPRLRLEAEMVRDQALAASGTLVRKMNGPSVFPKQPDGLWQAAFNGERTWATSVGVDSQRRGLYTFWRRTIPYPSMAAFDAPSRETCTLRRKSTNTPIQAFVTLNDPVYVELARNLASRIVREGGKSNEERARLGLQICLCREPTAEQIRVVVDLVEASKKSFDAESAKKWGTEPPAGIPAEEFAAWVLAANALMNLDGFLTKG
jgi:hypothetical protein